MTNMKKIACVSSECVACGTCVKVCPRQAISIDQGVIASVDFSLCVGCGKCAQVCPADVIIIKEQQENEKNEKTLV